MTRTQGYNMRRSSMCLFFFFQAEDGIRDVAVTGVQTCALPISVAIVDRAGSLVGVVTAGDLTRLMEKTDAFLDLPVGDVMTRQPKSTTRDELAGAAVRLMEQHGIMALPVLDGWRKLGGRGPLHDLMKAEAA